MGKGNHLSGKLSAVSLKKLKDGWHADGGNLYLFVRGTSRAWVFRYTSPITKKRTPMGMGSLENLGLSEARQRAAILRGQVKDPLNPIDPIDARDRAKDQLKAAAKKRTTFKQAAELCIKVKSKDWKNPKHEAQWPSTLEKWVYPYIGSLAVDLVDTQHIVKLLQQDVKNKQGTVEGSFWDVRRPTAERVMGRIESVIDYAKAAKLRTGENPATWGGLLENLLAKKSSKEEKHHPALPYKLIGDFMPKLKAKKGMSGLALQFSIMTVVRHGSVRAAKWDQIDFEELVWTIPAANTKTGEEHTVPLTPQMLALLDATPTIEGCDYVFPSPSKSPLSDMALSEIMRGMFAKGEIAAKAVPHGFRSTFSVWAAEQTSYPDEIRTACRMHTVNDKTKDAYERTTFFDKRRELMTQWCNYLDQPSIKGSGKTKNNVLPIKAVA